MKRINLKSKRKKTLIKKAIEISQMCQVDILLVIQDSEMNKMIEYNSGTKEKGLYTVDRALKAYHEVKCRKKKYQHFCDEIYDRFIYGKQKQELDDEDQELEIPLTLKMQRLDDSNSSNSLPTTTDNLENLIKEIEKMRVEIAQQLNHRAMSKEPMGK